jgi:plasmid maintenance system antidote protein VapI
MNNNEHRERIITFIKCLEKLNVLNREAAAMLGVHERTIYKWMSGQRPIPNTVLVAIGLLAREKERNLQK